MLLAYLVFPPLYLLAWLLLPLEQRWERWVLSYRGRDVRREEDRLDWLENRGR